MKFKKKTNDRTSEESTVKLSLRNSYTIKIISLQSAVKDNRLNITRMQILSNCLVSA